jgi:hypothetical protein
MALRNCALGNGLRLETQIAGVLVVCLSAL